MVSEVLVVGGGVAGGAAALHLAQNKVPIRLLEREAGAHHKVCGEFLSVEAQRDLARIGFDAARLGAVPIDRARVVRRGRQVEAALPFTALGISRMRLDEALLDAAGKAGAGIERGVKVTRIGDGEVQCSAGSLLAQHVFLASGKHDVRGVRRTVAALALQNDHVGFKMHWRVNPHQRRAMSRAIELVLFDGGYAGLQPVGEDTVNLCLIVRRSRLREEGGSWDALLAMLMRDEHLARRLADAEPLFSRPLTIANLPYGQVCDPDVRLPAGCFLLGDQAALTAPLTGDGMAIAVRSARHAVACLVAGAKPPDYHRLLRRTVGSQVRRAMTLQRCADSRTALPFAFGLLGLWPGLLARMARITRLAEENTV